MGNVSFVGEAEWLLFRNVGKKTETEEKKER